MSSALAQAEMLLILSRYVYSTHTFLLICDFSCLNLPGMVLQGVRRLKFGRTTYIAPRYSECDKRIDGRTKRNKYVISSKSKITLTKEPEAG